MSEIYSKLQQKLIWRFTSMVSESVFGSRIEEVWRKFPVMISVDVITFDPLLRFKLLSLLQSFFSLYSPVLRGCFYCTVPFCSGWSGGRTVFGSPNLLCIRRCWGRRVEDATGPRPNTLHAKHDMTWSAHQLLLMLLNSWKWKAEEWITWYTLCFLEEKKQWLWVPFSLCRCAIFVEICETIAPLPEPLLSCKANPQKELVVTIHGFGYKPLMFFHLCDKMSIVTRLEWRSKRSKVPFHQQKAKVTSKNKHV